MKGRNRELQGKKANSKKKLEVVPGYLPFLLLVFFFLFFFFLWGWGLNSGPHACYEGILTT
jgi:hypothetical protein